MKRQDSLADLFIKIQELQGEDILLEQRIVGLVQDLTAGKFAMMPVLKNVVMSGTPKRLAELSDYDDEQREIMIDNITLSFQDKYMIQPQAAAYVISSMAFAMGLTETVPHSPEDMRTEGNGGVAGEPSYVKTDDGEYCGYDKDGQHSGFGILKKEDGSNYVGDWRIGLRMGIGMSTMTDGSRYAGEWHLNRPNGIGTHYLNDGTAITGHWKNGKPDGWCMEYLPNGNAVCRYYERGRHAGRREIMLMQDGTDEVSG